MLSLLSLGSRRFLCSENTLRPSSGLRAILDETGRRDPVIRTRCPLQELILEQAARVGRRSLAPVLDSQFRNFETDDERSLGPVADSRFRNLETGYQRSGSLLGVAAARLLVCRGSCFTQGAVDRCAGFIYRFVPLDRRLLGGGMRVCQVEQRAFMGGLAGRVHTAIVHHQL